MVINKFALIILALMAVLSASSAEPTIVLLEGTPKWKELFTESEVVVLKGRDNEQLPGVTVHFRPNTMYELPLQQPIGDVSNMGTPGNLWDAVRAWAAIGIAKFLERPLPDNTWTAVTTAAYHGKVGKANADGEILEWPLIQELPASPDNIAPLRLYVGGVLEHNGYLVPLCIFAAHPPGTTPSKYLFDDVVSHDSHLQCVQPFIQAVGDTFRICDHGGPFGEDATQLARNVFASVHGDGNILVDVWFEPNLDRLLPKLSANPLPD
jgi:hypothetical protein